METFFYNRSLFNDLNEDIPFCYIQLDRYFDRYCDTFKEAIDANMEHAENICRRHADILLYAKSIREEYQANPSPFSASMRISTYLVGYFGAVKSFVDGIAIALNNILNFGLNPFDQDLTRDKIWPALSGHKTEDYSKHRQFLSDLKAWRNGSMHRLYPIVLTHSKAENIEGRAPEQVDRAKVDIKMVNIPNCDFVSFHQNAPNIEWVSPTHYIDQWNLIIEELADQICADIYQKIPKD